MYFFFLYVHKSCRKKNVYTFINNVVKYLNFLGNLIEYEILTYLEVYNLRVDL